MKTIGVVLLDERQQAVADALARNGYIIQCIKNQSQLEEVIGMDALVLPVRGVNDKEQIEYADGTMLDFRMMKKLVACGYPHLLIFTGTKNAIIDGWGLPVIHLMENEQVIAENAILTAQGILATILNHIKINIQGMSVDVIGYGHCGGWIAAYLAALGMKVRVVRRSLDEMEANHEIITDNIPSTKPNTLPITPITHITLAKWLTLPILNDIVINTAPALIIDKTRIASMENQPFLIDIASKPGGIDKEAAKQKGLTLYVAPPLPSIYAPISAGEILAKAIKEEMNNIE